jgi:hypothetical protein
VAAQPAPPLPPQPPLPPAAADPIQPVGAAAEIFGDANKRIVHRWIGKSGIPFEFHMSNPGYVNAAHADMPALLAESKEKWTPSPMKTRENHAIQQADRARQQRDLQLQNMKDTIEVFCDRIRDARKGVWLWESRASIHTYIRDAEKELEQKKKDALAQLGNFEGLDE